jgi:hypothetical protein
MTEESKDLTDIAMAVHELSNYDEEEYWRERTRLIGGLRADDMLRVDGMLELLERQDSRVERAVTQLAEIAKEMGPFPKAPGERNKYQQELLAAWPEACRRAGVAVSEIPTRVLQAIWSSKRGFNRYLLLGF